MPKLSTATTYSAAQVAAIKGALQVSEIDAHGNSTTRDSTDDEVGAWLDRQIASIVRRDYAVKESAKNAGVAAAQAAGF